MPATAERPTVLRRSWQKLTAGGEKKRNQRYIKRMIWLGRTYDRLSFPVTTFI
ncbi:MAG: hypothetical protein JWM05_3473, partial [Acidimicrobiales bacterium]|nr:hypothetical protein [Acidimicrobiales bacterium]